ncbi:MAG: biotin--[acetyl-CoA-carboxylase] ligase [Chloroflexota bacterium]
MTDGLSASSISAGLGTELIGRKVIYRSRVASTMDEARREARQGAAAGTVIVADEQTAGRGRIKRLWLTPGGNIALSVILYPEITSLPYLIMMASLAVSYSIEAVTGLAAQIKWPNDVLINGKKVCGILVESDVRRGGVAYAIIGIGVNVALLPSDYPEIETTATSLAAETGGEVSRLAVIRRLLVEMDRLYQSLPGGGAVYEQWRQRLVTLGRRVRVVSGSEVLEGIAESVAAEGSLLLRRADGSTTMIVAGDVTLRETKG